MYRQKHMYRRLRDNPGMVMPGIPQRTVVLLNIFVRNGYTGPGYTWPLPLPWDVWILRQSFEALKSEPSWSSEMWSIFRVEINEELNCSNFGAVSKSHAYAVTWPWSLRDLMVFQRISISSIGLFLSVDLAIYSRDITVNINYK